MSPTEQLPFTATIDQESRRSLVRGRGQLNGIDLDGIDYVEVLSNHEDSPGYVPGAPPQRTVLLHLLNGPVPATWGAEVVRFVGGVRQDPTLNPVEAVWAHPALALLGTVAAPVPAGALPDGVTGADQQLLAQALTTDEARARALAVRTTSSGDWSTYTVRLVDPDGVGAPTTGTHMVDLALSTASFTFTIDCPSDLDCAVECMEPPVPEELLPGDYLARDYEALRTRLLDRLATLLPDWDDRNPADPAVMLAELFAAVGDRLAYWQDAIAVEAYLGTARQRTSVRRHARLLGYTVHEGCSARTLLAFHTDSDVTIAPHTPVTDLVPHPGLDIEGPIGAADLGAAVFETVTEVAIRPGRNALPLYAWGDPDHCLPLGATAAFVTTPTGVEPGLAAGDLIVLADQPVQKEGESPERLPRFGDPALRFAVRLVQDARKYAEPLNQGVVVWELRWSAADALTAPLRVTQPGTSDPRAVALANVVVADHGASVLDEPIVPPTVPGDTAYRPRLQRPGLAFVDPQLPRTDAATALLVPDPRQARAAVTLFDGQHGWEPYPDLLASGRLDPHFVVEPEPGGVSRLRFGDGLGGRTPVTGLQPKASYRVGAGAAGNLAPDRLTVLLPLADGRPALPGGAAVWVWNPLPATGGTEPERVDQVKQLAPAAFRQQLRAVTSPDYAAVAEQHAGTQRAVARRRWTGSWYAEEVTLDPIAGHDDEALRTAVTASLEVRRMAGVDVELERPVYVPLELGLGGCVLPGFLRADVESRLREVFGSGLRPDGLKGFFHPDRFSFGEPLRLSDVVAAAMAVDGLAWVELDRFARADASRDQAAQALAAGVLVMAPRELLRCDSDPNNPEAGHIEFSLGGGS